MTIISSVLLSGWFHLILLGTIFFIYSGRIFRRGVLRGYALGWLLGLFFIFTYVSLRPPETLQLGASDQALNILQVLGAGTCGIFISAVITMTVFIFRKNRIQQALHTAAITAILVIAIFLQLIAEPEIRLMVSLFVLAFGMASLTANIISGRRMRHATPNPDEPYPNDENQPQPTSHSEAIRSRVKRRVNMNDVPSDLPSYPTQDLARLCT